MGAREGRFVLFLRFLPQLQSLVELQTVTWSRKRKQVSVRGLGVSPYQCAFNTWLGNIIYLRKQYISCPLLEIGPCWELQQSHLVPEACQWRQSSRSWALTRCFVITENRLGFAETWHFLPFGFPLKRNEKWYLNMCGEKRKRET